MKKVYIAAPFFNDYQRAVVHKIEAMLASSNVPFFSPRLESNFKQGDDPSIILEINCNAIHHSEYVIVVTDGKDIGTIWEAGFAYAVDRPVLYAWLDYQPGMKFNIMLAASGSSVVHTMHDLSEEIISFKTNKKFINEQNKDYLHE